MLDLIDKVLKFTPVYYHEDATGYIVWRLGTGENVELLHIHTNERGKGHGRRLFYHMLKEIERKGPEPYHSIFGFTRVSNQEAQAFYGALGFVLDKVNGPYQDGHSIFFSAPYSVLLESMKEFLRARTDPDW